MKLALQDSPGQQPCDEQFLPLPIHAAWGTRSNDQCLVSVVGVYDDAASYGVNPAAKKGTAWVARALQNRNTPSYQHNFTKIEFTVLLPQIEMKQNEVLCVLAH